jgi:hypothetical protein
MRALALLGSVLILGVGCSSKQVVGQTPTTGHVPEISGAVPKLLPTTGTLSMPGFSNGFTLLGTATAGTASVVNAPYWDANSPTPPATNGSGAFSVTVDGVAYTSAAAMSYAALQHDPTTSTDYLVFGAQALEASSNTVNEVFVIVLKSDFSVGGTVSLDGSNRMALFVTGPADANQPTMVAAATSGSVTFTAGGIKPTDTLSATLSADFAKTDWAPAPAGPTKLVAGNYQLKVSGSTAMGVKCQGDLTGKEGSFTAVTPAQLGLLDGPVTLALPAAGQVSLTGPAAGPYGGSPLLLLEIDTPDMYASMGGPPAMPITGPLGTDLGFVGLMIDGTTATASLIQGQAGAGFMDNQDGNCTVTFAVTLTP